MTVEDLGEPSCSFCPDQAAMRYHDAFFCRAHLVWFWLAISHSQKWTD